jgi:hypothetical protein
VIALFQGDLRAPAIPANVYVGGIGPKVTEEIQSSFARFGEIIDVR